MTFKLFATDLDGTLLNTKKGISPGNSAAIHNALDQNKIIIFSTGRCLGEVGYLMRDFPAMRYVICESGANVYDCYQKQLIFSKLLEKKVSEKILQYALGRDIMIQVMLDGNSVISKKHMEKLEYYRASQYQEHFRKTSVIVQDFRELCQKSGWKIAKFCLYHPDVEAREITRSYCEGLPVVLSDAEESMLEISPEGIDKGVGLERLCEHLKISLEETIVIGDSYNDLPILKKAGLSVAVENAREEVKNFCDVIVADNDHDGVKEVIEKYLIIK